MLYALPSINPTRCRANSLWRVKKWPQQVLREQHLEVLECKIVFAEELLPSVGQDVKVLQAKKKAWLALSPAFREEAVKLSWSCHRLGEEAIFLSWSSLQLGDEGVADAPGASAFK